ncbi:NRDE family protein [Salinimicrobium gaetbulicola]|uniref:NRDE family protein n=1 Tax=Salinimicrobium gaetbulicola TaxID=999702 RepID=A0ABW3IF57_9FLAO
MCTVTLIPFKSPSEGFILTSNRDEANGRKTLPPKIYSENDILKLYPKDEVGGGTWIGVSERKRTICLLNGEFERHERKPPYRLSRGVVVKDLLDAPVLTTAIKDYDLENVEPFTVIGVDWSSELKLLELVWDGRRKHLKALESEPHIWSSSPLYTSEMKLLRESWFREFRKERSLTAEDLLDFHTSAGTGDKNVDVIMDRGFIKTQSISQVALSEGKLKFYYRNLLSDEITKIEISEDLRSS